MKLTKQRLEEIIKEELQLEYSKPFRQWSDHTFNLDKLLISTHWAAKAVPHKKKEVKEIQKLTQKLKNLVDIILGQVVDM